MATLSLDDLRRDLAKKIAKAKPTFEQYEKGELKVLNEVQERHVNNYKKWCEDLEDVKAGRMPGARPSPPPAKAKAAAAAAAEPTAENGNGEAEAEDATQNGKGAKATPAKKKAPSKSKAPKAEKEQAMSHKNLIHLLKNTEGARERRLLIESQIQLQVNKSKLVSMVKEYDALAQLRRDIEMGTIATPNKVQLARVNLLGGIQKEMQAEQARIKEQVDRLRMQLLAEAGDTLEDGAPPAKAPEPEPEPEKEAEPEPEPEPEKEPEPEEEARSPTPPAKEKSPEAAPAEPEAAPEPEPAAEPEPEPEPEPEEEPVKEEKKPKGKGKKEAPKEPTPDPTPEPTPEETPIEPPEPEAPKELDWSEVVITKNKRGADYVEAPSAIEEDVAALLAKIEDKPYVNPAQVTPVVIGAAPDRKAKKVAAPVYTGMQQSASARLTRDLAFCEQNPIDTVRYHLIDDNLFIWHVNVTPNDGPLAGCIVHLEIRFGDLYPTEPPLVRSFTDIPHPSIMSYDVYRNVLCMEHTARVSQRDTTPGRGWTPAYGAWSVLSQLQSFFAKENFARVKKALGGSWKSRIGLARGDLSRLACSTCPHTPERPSPIVTVRNGPFEFAPEALQIVSGVMKASGAEVSQACVHKFSGDGKHRVRATFGSGHSKVGFATSNDKDRKPLGEDGLCYDGATGTTVHNGSDVGEGPSAKAGDVLDVVLDLGAGVATFTLNGKEVGTVSGLDKDAAYHPAFHMAKNARLELEIVYYDEEDWRVKPTATPKPAEATDAFKCFVTLASIRDGILGIGVQIGRTKKLELASLTTPSMEFVSQEAFEKLNARRSSKGEKLDAFLPLMIDDEHGHRSFSAMKKYVSALCRNPQASMFYEPPFRAAHALSVFPLLLKGVVKQFVDVKRDPEDKAPVFAALRWYGLILQCLVALAIDTPALVDEAVKSLDQMSSATVLALSPIVMAWSWPDVATQALRAELKAQGAAADVSDAAGFKAIKPKLRTLLTFAAFSQSFGMTSTRKLQEELANSMGAPSDYVLNDVVNRLSQIQNVTTWETLCDFLKVNLSAQDALQ